ncbi:hypothetical protein SPRG_03869 [Saprolegnia parasitica CBS 223.65]|uniref:Ribosomal protein L1 n=1 Tax=Saprolegnia parasitica (strain CBS 223.65) TaxID=695850 RepID=A0A067CWU0_SAPPC|nr:hypothetical protein SPRG_03869 [Saprolegnia parasitica CBS 223.65]KDO31252.1 hypothetical protein SPRG_03869 [Saprolegnia parasitica CBS 223.65]|eukprot:XP_012197854.1 hypothetical protein SPRG_03869 [Saprolegnia parasitica CBS 223.65]
MERLVPTEVKRAVVALQQFQQKQAPPTKKKHKKHAVVSLIVTRKKVPATVASKPVPIALPHSLRLDGDAILLVKDIDLKRIKDSLAKDPVPGVAKVMGLKQLKTQLKEPREFRALYTTFLADDRVLKVIKATLGKKFFDATPLVELVPVLVAKRDVSEYVRRALDGTTMVPSPGPCINVKVAIDLMPAEVIMENIAAATAVIVDNIGRKWKNVKSISIKTTESIALPIYHAPVDGVKKPETAAKKRKSDDSAKPATKKVKRD